MEELVLNSLHLKTSNPMNISTKRVENSVSHATATESSGVSNQPEDNCHNEGVDMSKEIPLSRPESPLSTIGHLGLVRNQRNALQTELRYQQDTAADAKKSISSLRKLALRLAVRISVKEANIASHSKALAKARMNQYLLEQQEQHLLSPSHVRSGNFPISPPQSPGPNKPLPSLPRPDNSSQGSTVRFTSPWHDTSSIQDVIDNGEDRLIKMDASRASLKEELETTQRKLETLFESQALLREKYNLERERSKNLDAECQQTHARISSLEESKRQIEEETRSLHAHIEDLDQANVHLRAELDDAKVARHNIEEDLGKVQSSKLTLEHQLQAAVGSKDLFEDQLSSLKASNDIVNQELQKKLQALQDDSILSAEAILALQSAKSELNEELRVANFRLCAAIDLEIQLRTQLVELHDRERSLESDLDTSRLKVTQLEEDLQLAHQRLAEMDKSVFSLSEKLEESEKAKTELEEVTRLALFSREQVGTHLREMEMDKAKVDVWLRATREQLAATETVKTEVESEIQELRTDLAQVQKRNEDLETLVEKAETKLSVVVEKTTASVNHLEAIVAKNNKEREALPEASTSCVEQQLIAHQKEIETLHRTNDNLMEKLDIMTKELVQLKNGGLIPSGLHSRSVSRFTDTRPGSRLTNERSTSRLTNTRPGSPPEVIAAEELYDLEVKQLRETRATFDRVVKSLRNKNTELDLLEKWHDADVEDNSPTPRRIPSPVDSIHNSTDMDPVVEGIGRAVAAMQPTVVAGHDAASEMGILEMPPSRPLRKSASEGALRSWKDDRVARWTESIATSPQGHSHSRSNVLSYKQNDVLSEREAILRVGFITSPSVSPVSQRGMRFWKELPSRPSVSSGLVSPRDVIDKQLPPIPRRPVVRSRSLNSSAEILPPLRRTKTTSDLKTKDHVWSLFPKATQSIDIGRPSTANGYTPFNSGPKKWSFEASPVVGEKNVPQSPGLTQVTTIEDLRARARVLMEAQKRPPLPPPPPVQEVEVPQRHLRLKKSIALLTNLSKKTEGSGHDRNLSDGNSRIRALFRRPSKLLRGRENSTPTSETGPQNMIPFTSIPESTPEPIVDQPPLSPVGIYDHVSKMWLTPQKSPTRTQFGVFDPESKKWMAPSPRSDSLRRVVAIDPNGTIVSGQRNSGATDRTNEEEEGALSLAEKLEIIRYKPLSHTFSSPDTSIEPSQSLMTHSLTRTETASTLQTLQLQDRPRPWKPGQLLGLKTPPKDNGLDGTPLDDEDLENLSFSPPFAHDNNSFDQGSGYMSFESEQEARGPWKVLMKNVHVPHMLKRSSNLRHE